MGKKIPEWVQQSRSGWVNTGKTRPSFAIAPGEGEESVWDYPRPPVIVPDSRLVTVHVGDYEIARTSAAVRILETASPPTFYLPGKDVREDLFGMSSGSSMCEWKGPATYWSVVVNGSTIEKAAWSYPDPFPEFTDIRGYYSFYPAKVTCRVDGNIVRPQPGGFYGGWVTNEVVGPFKGEPGTSGW